MFHPQGPTFWELARQALSSTERGYDLLAPKFDHTPFRTPDELLAEAVAPLGPPRSLDQALDICCGTGAALRAIRPLCRERVVGIDMSRGMLSEARRRVEQADDRGPRRPDNSPDNSPGNSPGNSPDEPPAKAQFVRGNVLDMPLERVFDLAVCFGALGHILPRDEARFVRQIASVLRPGGRFVFVTSYLPSKLSTSYWLARGFNAAMHVRNWTIRPPFVMYYLTFLLPGCARLLEDAGFEVQVLPEQTLASTPRLRLVIATLGDPASRSV